MFLHDDVSTWDRPRLSSAAEALVKIGKPSVSAIINFLATKDDATSVSAWHACAVLCEIEGREAAQRMLKDAAAAEKDPAKRAALQSHLEALPNIMKAMDSHRR
jgi:HEAT repeat protein